MVKCSGWFVARSVACTMVPMLATSVRGVGEISAARADELGFQVGFAPHQQLLHFLGGLVFVVFAQVAVAAGHGDFL